MSVKRFEASLLGLLGDGTVPDPADQINPGEDDQADTARTLNAAFLITLAGPGHRLFWEADVLFEKIIRTEEGARLGRYYQRGRSAIWKELQALDLAEPRLEETLAALANALGSPAGTPRDQETLLSKIPVTVAHLRCAVDAAALFSDGRDGAATELLEQAVVTATASTGSP